MDLFRETDYRRIVEELFRQKPKHGHGEMSRLARHLKVNTTLVSQVLSAKRDFTEEQAVLTAQFFEFNRRESYYFLLLVQRSRAATEALKEVYSEQIRLCQSEAQNGLKNRVSVKKELSFEEQAVYYSSWLYAALHTLVGIEGCQDVASLSQKLGLQPPLTRALLDRLIEYNLVVEKGSRFVPGVASTYLPPESPLVIRHHQSWRQVATQRMERSSARDFFFTGPLSISEADYESFRRDLVELVGRLYKIVEKSRAQEFACFNVDLFRF